MSISIGWLVLLERLYGWLKSPDTYRWVKARQLRREEKERKEKAMKVILSMLIFGCALISSCATCDKVYIWAYEGLNGTNITQEATCGVKAK